MNFAHAKPPHGSCAAQAVLQLPRLKWYCVAAPDQPVPPEIEAMARSVPAETDLQSVSAFGFVVLHRCGSDFYFLIVCSWQAITKFGKPSMPRIRLTVAFATGRDQARMSQPSASGKWARSPMRVGAEALSDVQP
jgi:hypothetical protein